MVCTRSGSALDALHCSALDLAKRRVAAFSACCAALTVTGLVPRSGPTGLLAVGGRAPPPDRSMARITSSAALVLAESASLEGPTRGLVRLAVGIGGSPLLRAVSFVFGRRRAAIRGGLLVDAPRCPLESLQAPDAFCTRDHLQYTAAPVGLAL